MAAPFSRARQVEAHGTPRARYRGRCCARIGRIWDVQFKDRRLGPRPRKSPNTRLFGRVGDGVGAHRLRRLHRQTVPQYITRPSPPPPWRGMVRWSCRSSWFDVRPRSQYKNIVISVVWMVCILVHAPRVDGQDSRWQVQVQGGAFEVPLPGARRPPRSGAAAAAAERPIDSGSGETPP